ncbi:MAG: hypothetical protein R3284_10510, partial [Rubricoccaceae bacterium]|nr:hypothetical protein [Rubricoccaceae bacterium]
MDSIAVKVLDPAGQHWAQLLNPLHTVTQLVPVLVQRLALPDELKYELVPEDTGRPLSVNETLSGAGIAAGASLLIRPVRDGLFAAFMDALYEQAIKFAAQEVWDGVKSSLETIHRLDPSYPDKEGLWRKVGMRAAKGFAGGAGTAAPGAITGATGTAAAGAAAGTAVATGAAQTATSAAASGGSMSFLGCMFIIFFGAVVCGGILIFTGIVPAPTWAPDWLTGIIPNQDGSGSTMARPDEPQLGTGDVQVTLRWDTQADIDLHVTDPSGEEIFYGHTQSASGGQLDVDANAGCSNDPQVENIYWPTGGAPSGTYQLSVNYFGACGAGATNYEVL